MKIKIRILFTLFFIFILSPLSLIGEKGKPILFPNLYKSKPGIPSPYTLRTSGSPVYSEYVTLQMPTENEYAVVDVTQEKGKIYSCMHSLFGKGNQLWIDSPDFPSLGRIGLHSDNELNRKKYITGRKIELINYLARPGRFSHSGFIAADEDIISILKQDNRTVRKMDLKHTDLAKPLFHVWNFIQGGYIRGRWAKNIILLYNGNKILINAEGGKGYQESIFHDEIEGKWNISIRRELRAAEIKNIRSHYKHLPEVQFEKLLAKLSRMDISEMNPFYIQRYGFYEGHTNYRADPIAISLIFGLKSLKEVIKIFGKNLSENI